MMLDDGAGEMIAAGCRDCRRTFYPPIDSDTCPVCGGGATLRLQLQWKILDDAASARALADLSRDGVVVLPMLVGGVA